MSKYLLLRDNKQSGPYTVQEIISKGIKPYDLVWLEGKSAAWRYPSEIEELKAYAPAVEEQPFDRFYKKPSAEADSKPVIERKSPFEPVIADETFRPKPAVSKKVYINFPGGSKKVTVYAEPKPAISPAVDHERPAAALAPTPPPASERKLLYAVAAACFVLLVIISVLIINYGNQRSNIRQLNDMVQQMEKRQHESNTTAQTALASRILPTPRISQDLSTPADQGIKMVTPVVARKTSPPQEKILVADATPIKPLVKEEQPPAERPVKAATPPPAKENLFSLVSVKPNKYKTGVLGGISNLQFELSNNSSHQLQKVAVEIKYLSPEKKIVKTQTIFFENVAPGSQPVLEVPKSNRGVSIDFTITDIKS
jgi:hypothetical protein